MVCPLSLVVSRWVDGDLSRHEEVRVRRHLEACLCCRQLRDELLALKELLASCPPAGVGPDFWFKIARRLSERPLNLWTSFHLLIQRLTPAIVSTVLFLVFSLTFVLLSDSSATLRNCDQYHLLIEREQISRMDVFYSLAANRADYPEASEP